MCGIGECIKFIVATQFPLSPNFYRRGESTLMTTMSMSAWVRETAK